MSRKIPLEDFFRNPEKTRFQISRNGEYLSWMAPWNARLNVFTQHIDSKKEYRVTGETERNVAGYFWGSNNRIVFLKDKGGDENFHLYSVSVDGKEERDLTPFDGITVQIIDDLEENDNEVIIGMNQRNKPRGYGGRLIRFVRDRRGRNPITLARDADMAQAFEVAYDLVEPGLRIRKVAEPCDNGLDKFARQPRHALVLGLDAGRGLQHQPCYVDGQTKGQHQCQEQVDAGSQGQSLPHRMFPVATLNSLKRHDIPQPARPSRGRAASQQHRSNGGWNGSPILLNRTAMSPKLHGELELELKPELKLGPLHTARQQW